MIKDRNIKIDKKKTKLEIMVMSIESLVIMNNSSYAIRERRLMLALK